MFTLEDIRKAFQAGHERGVFDANHNYFDAPLDEDEYIKSLTEEPQTEEKVTITYSLIKATVGWSRFCDITGFNHYAINEFGEPSPRETFDIVKAEYDKLWGGK